MTQILKSIGKFGIAIVLITQILSIIACGSSNTTATTTGSGAAGANNPNVSLAAASGCAKGVCPQQSVSATLTTSPNNPYVYQISVGIGNPAQSIPLLFDTGSPALAVVGSACLNCDINTPSFTPTSQPLVGGEEGVFPYGDGNYGFYGQFYPEVVTIAGATTTNLNVVVITSEFDSEQPVSLFAADLQSGIIGMSASVNPQLPYQPYISKAGVFGDIFAVQLCPPTAHIGGHVWFAGYDPSFVTSPPQFVAVNSTDGSWQIPIDGISVGSTNLPNSGFDAIIDTGTPYVVLPTNAYNALLGALQENPNFAAFGGETFLNDGNCITSTSLSLDDVDNQFPSVQLNLTGYTQNNTTVAGIQTITMPASQFYLEVLSDTPTQGATTICPFVAENTTQGGIPILGAIFMNNYVTVFDSVLQQIGFSPQTSTACN